MQLELELRVSRTRQSREACESCVNLALLLCSRLDGIKLIVISSQIQSIIIFDKDTGSGRDIITSQVKQQNEHNQYLILIIEDTLT